MADLAGSQVRARRHSRRDGRRPLSRGPACTAHDAQQAVPGRAAVPNARGHSDMDSSELNVLVLDGSEVTWATLAVDGRRPFASWHRLSRAPRDVEQPER